MISNSYSSANISFVEKLITLPEFFHLPLSFENLLLLFGFSVSVIAGHIGGIRITLFTYQKTFAISYNVITVPFKKRWSKIAYILHMRSMNVQASSTLVFWSISNFPEKTWSSFDIIGTVREIFLFFISISCAFKQQESKLF